MARRTAGPGSRSRRGRGGRRGRGRGRPPAGDRLLVRLHALVEHAVELADVQVHRRPVAAVADGQVRDPVRVQGAPIWSRTFGAIGMSPTVIAYNEVYNAIQNGVIAAGENEAAGVEQMKFYEVAPDLAMTQHAITIRPLCFSGKTFAKLPADLQAAIIKAGKEAGAYDLHFAASAGADEAAKKSDAAKACMTLRTDGVAVDIDGDYTETLSRIAANKDAIGVFGLSFFQNNTDKLQVATINGIVPSVETVAAGDYPVSRPLYFYVKKAHLGVIPGLQEYIDFFVSDDMAGPDGPLAAYGLVPDPELAATQAAVAAGTVMGPLE